METKLYNVSVYTENQVGLLSTIANMFTRRSLNIESLTVFPTKLDGVHHFNITTRATAERIENTVRQIEKKVDVIKAYYYIDEELKQREMNDIMDFFKSRQ